MKDSNLYSLRITKTDSDDVLVTATVDVVDGTARIVEIHARTSVGHDLPTSLTSIDLSLLIRTQLLLSGSSKLQDSRGTDTESDVKKVADQEPQTSIQATSPSISVAPERRPNKDDMPSDFGVYYWRLGSLAKVAKHYDVPHHVAQSWIKKLQRDGKVASQWPKNGTRKLR